MEILYCARHLALYDKKVVANSIEIVDGIETPLCFSCINEIMQENEEFRNEEVL